MKDSDVVSEVGAESQLGVEVDATTETHKYILQRNESNLGFLKRLAAPNFSCVWSRTIVKKGWWWYSYT